MLSKSDGYQCDEWPILPDGQEYDGRELLALVRDGDNPFQNVDMNLVFREVEAAVGATIIDIPIVIRGFNNLGLYCKLSDQQEDLAHLGRSDVNMPNYDGFDLDALLGDINFEIAAYDLLENSEVPVLRLLYSRLPVQRTGHTASFPTDITGRRLMVFRKLDGRDNVWHGLSSEEKLNLLAQAARIRASLFNFISPPRGFSLAHSSSCRKSYLSHSQPRGNSGLLLFIFQSKIEANIGEECDRIGWESDNNTFGPRASKAKQSLLRFVPNIFPAGAENEWLYRRVLEHGDYGIYNMSITGEPLITSLYDWETGCIVPALLADPEMAVPVDLTADENGEPRITRVGSDATGEERDEYMKYAGHYLTNLYKGAPDFKRAIIAGKDARYLWYALKNWRGDGPEDFLGSLGEWADRRMLEIGAG